MNESTNIATLAGGCFWCLEAVYENVRGVSAVESGYSGGSQPDPSYESVSYGDSGHAEVVQITFDPQIISYKDLLNIFFAIHDPTTLNRQGADVGTQYRSAIYYHNEAQRKISETVIEEITAASIWDAPIITEVSPLEPFYVAEDYHQKYFANNANQPYCRAVVAPKVAKFRSQFKELLK